MQYLGQNTISYGKHHSLEKNRWNEKGFFENDLILRFNVKALEAAGGSWKNVRQWSPREQSRIMAKLPELKNILQNDYLSESQPIFVIKDPRIIWIWDVYMQALNELNIEVFVVHIDRNNEEVAKSLWEPHKIPYQAALKLTDDYKNELLKNLKKSIPEDHIFHTTYSALIKDPVFVLKDINNKLFRLPEDRIDITGISGFIDKSLKHH
jgi:hypothetical protein